MSYVKSRKNFEVGGNFLLLFYCVQKKAHGKFNTLPCAMSLSCAKVRHTLCRVPLVCRVFIYRHSAKLLFAVCPRNCIRQTRWHTANAEFPVVDGAGVRRGCSVRAHDHLLSRHLRKKNKKLTV